MIVWSRTLPAVACLLVAGAAAGHAEERPQIATPQIATTRIGVPLTSGAVAAFRAAVNACKSLSVGAQAAQVVVVASFGLTPAGRVDGAQPTLSLTRTCR